MDLSQLLPDDVLARVLRRLAPRCLAVSRSVCKEWCAVIDTRRLLRADLLPLSLYGIMFVEKLLTEYYPKFFRLPSPERKISLKFDDYLVAVYSDQISDHCNGLLLLQDWVTNPATRQCVQLPPNPPPCIGMEDFYMDRCLVFDPMVSPHYEVFFIPCAPRLSELSDNTKFTERSEWPPSPYPIHVFSSRTRRWEERSFVREGEATGTIADMQSTWRHRYIVYWKGAIYVHCQNNSIMRLTLSNNRYQVIKWPTGSVVVDRDDLHMGKSKQGVYCVLICIRWRQLRVWHLNESHGQMEWVLKNDVSLRPLCFPVDCDNQNNGSWILEQVNRDYDTRVVATEEKFEWDIQNGIILEKEENVELPLGRFYFLGFHPYENIAFLWVPCLCVIAYHLNSSKVQHLGKFRTHSVGKHFSYTPCWMTEVLENNQVN